MTKQAILVGNSDGIGLAMTQRLLAQSWKVTGFSRSKTSIRDKLYTHFIADVTDDQYPQLLAEQVQKMPPALVIYFAGIGEPLDLQDMSMEEKIIAVNLLGMIRTTAVVIPTMVRNTAGHFIGISSFADELLSAEAPSYHASKAGFSNYLGGLALALKSRGVFVSNVRFGFVDTKMAKGDVKPLMISVDKAVDHLEICMRRKPACYTAPRLAIPLVKFRKLMMRLST
jgi:short-subunit dehydrogenase